jgi:hypothetical protein
MMPLQPGPTTRHCSWIDVQCMEWDGSMMVSNSNNNGGDLKWSATATTTAGI